HPHPGRRAGLRRGDRPRARSGRRARPARRAHGHARLSPRAARPSAAPAARRRPPPDARLMLDLAAADERLAAADPALPGLRDVLAPLGLVRRLAPGWGVRAARVAYLRYKPGTSLLAGLVLTDDDGVTSFAQALALRAGSAEKL